MGRSRLVLCALLSVIPAARPAPPPAEGKVRGSVWQRETNAPLAGARVVALAEGVFPVAEAVTDAEGRFELALAEGTYDVRATAHGHVAGILRDASVAPAAPVEKEFELVPFAQAIVERGFEAGSFDDGDGDFVPDRVERTAGLDPELADSDEDGIGDGVAQWLGVVAERPDRGGSPQVLSPNILVPLPCSSSIPFPIVLGAVPGATTYRLEVTPRLTNEVLGERTYEFENDDFVVGEGVALRWTPPAGLEGGSYRLHARAYVTGRAEPIGYLAVVGFQLEERELEPLELAEDVELEGLVAAREIRVLSGVTVRVPAGGFLRLAATGGITVEHGARVVGGPGASLELAAGADVVIRGSVAAGTGADAAEDTGLAGGQLLVAAGGAVVVARDGRLASGGGGAGAFAEGGRNAPRAGDGGPGGNLVVLAEQLFVADRPGRIDAGEGGPGGSGECPGAGGASGDAWLSDWNVRADGLVDLDDPSFPVCGGRAGEPGAARVPASAASELDHAPPPGRRGGRGWLEAGPGSPALARAGAGSGHGRGGHAAAAGGHGGDVARMGLGQRAFNLLFAFRSRGGAGGSSDAESGPGGPGDGTGTPGPGGDAQAAGGYGGRALGIAVALPSVGGAGGDAVARGADGQPGADHCQPKPFTGGSGGSAGSAQAVGGKGGDSVWYGGAGGSARATGGRGGEGGDGSPPGNGGRGGRASVRAAAGGFGGLQPGAGGEGVETHGERGPDGGSCER